MPDYTFKGGVWHVRYFYLTERDYFRKELRRDLKVLSLRSLLPCFQLGGDFFYSVLPAVSDRLDAADISHQVRFLPRSQ